MTTAPKRAYKGTDTEMLLAISTIMASAVSYEKVLVPKHKNWNAPFFANLQADSKAVPQKYVGVDSAAKLRQATKALTALRQTAFSNLGDIRASINAGFLANKARRKELFKNLGYDSFNDAARRHDQEALINLLSHFAKAATPDVQDELINEGANGETLAAIIAAAQPFMDAETAQEGFKGTRPATTAEAVLAYNDIFERVMSVAKNAARDFKTDPAKAKQFSYAHVLKLQGGDKGDDDDNGSTATTPSN